MNTLTLQASKRTIAFEDRGAGPVVVLVHAFPFDSGMWQGQIAAMADAYRIIAPDLPGFGGSAVFTGLTVDSAAEMIAELLDHLGINERITVGGLSMGGYIALAFARLYPQRVRALILADTKAAPDDEAGRAGRDRMVQLVGDRGTVGVVEQLMPKLLGSTTKAKRPDVIQSVRSIANRQPPDGLAAALRALRDRPDAGPSLVHIAVPSLVLVGDEDSITPPSQAQILANAIPNARFVSIAGAGHLSNLERPAVFSSAVREFLDHLNTESGAAGAV